MRRSGADSERFQSVVHSIITYGEDPAVVAPRDRAWTHHLNQYRNEYGAGSWVLELLRGAVGHVWWRLTVSRQRSSLSTGFAAIGAGVASIGLMAASYEDFVSVTAEAHSALGLLAIGAALAWKPWTLSRRRISVGSLAASSGLAHLALSTRLFVWFDYVLIVGLATAAAGLSYVGLSGLRTRSALGASRLGVWLVFGGALLVGCAQLLWAFEPTDGTYAAFSAIAAFASAVAGLRILDLWAMQEPPPPSALRLLGGGRRRQRTDEGAGWQRSPLTAS